MNFLSGTPNETPTRQDSGSNTGSMEQDDQDQDQVADSSQQDNLTGEDRDSPISAESGQVQIVGTIDQIKFLLGNKYIGTNCLFLFLPYSSKKTLNFHDT